jgi:hypothetical protein
MNNENLQLPIRLGKEKPKVHRELDMFSTPSTDDEARYVLILMEEKAESEAGRVFHQIIWGLYVCYRHQGMDVIYAWIEALANSLGVKERPLVPPPSSN